MTEAGKEPCPTKAQLLTEWQTATEVYSKAVAELSRNIGVIPKSEYEKLSQAAERARKKSLEAKTALEVHTTLHGCDGSEVAA